MKTARCLPIVFILATAACGPGAMGTYYKAVSTTAILAVDCRDTLSEGHEQKTDAMEKKAKAGDKAGAQADLNAWMPVYEKIKIACVSAKAGSRVALNAGPSIEAAINKDKEIAAWVARLAKLGLDVTAALAEAGLKLPGGKQ